MFRLEEVTSKGLTVGIASFDSGVTRAAPGAVQLECCAVLI